MNGTLRKLREHPLEVAIGIMVTALITGVGFSIKTSHDNSMNLSHLMKSHNEIKETLKDRKNEMDKELKVIKQCLVVLMIKQGIDIEEIKKLISYSETKEEFQKLIMDLDMWVSTRKPEEMESESVDADAPYPDLITRNVWLDIGIFVAVILGLSSFFFWLGKK